MPSLDQPDCPLAFVSSWFFSASVLLCTSLSSATFLASYPLDNGDGFVVQLDNLVSGFRSSPCLHDKILLVPLEPHVRALPQPRRAVFDQVSQAALERLRALGFFPGHSVSLSMNCLQSAALGSFSNLSCRAPVRSSCQRYPHTIAERSFREACYHSQHGGNQDPSDFHRMLDWLGRCGLHPA